MNRLFSAALLLPALAFAAAKPGDVNEATYGIVTPDVATGMWATGSYSVDTQGDVVLCLAILGGTYSNRDGTCDGKPGPNRAWVKLRNAVPAGKVYVGFRVVSGAYGYRQIEVYWK